ncbi:hypothetical protein BG011_000022 [Mortierella polycephala]|uniref:RRM domain-containing protein n=1 Tax=Mortierella polycephala TaxID=41804 RepID=A0A9P6QJ14_9FUNG|nr:hypothetical protein BG011_000022 [Mortierella polycephala]
MASSTSTNPLTYRTTQKDHGLQKSAVPPKATTPLDDKRIYVGNLDPTIDEYTVLKLFTPFGKITKLDFMFHWHGPKKGTPRGYCFIEFENPAQAAAAIKQMNRKAIKLRPLSVSLANMAPPSTDNDSQGRKRILDPNRPTTFSLLKSGALKNASTDEKIKAMERKLAQMAQPPKPPKPTLAPAHVSLPPKPTASMASAASSRMSNNNHRGAGVSSSSITAKRHRPY